MTAAPTYDQLLAALDEFHQAWNAQPWSLDRLQAIDDHAADLVTRADSGSDALSEDGKTRSARRLPAPTGQPPEPDPDTPAPAHARGGGSAVPDMRRVT